MATMKRQPDRRTGGTASGPGTAPTNIPASVTNPTNQNLLQNWNDPIENTISGIGSGIVSGMQNAGFNFPTMNQAGGTSGGTYAPYLPEEGPPRKTELRNQAQANAQAAQPSPDYYLGDPGMMEQFAQSLLNQYMQGGMTPLSSQVNLQQIMDMLGGDQWGQQYTQDMLGGMTGPSTAEQRLGALSQQATAGDAGLDPYYENALRRAQENIGQQTSALGAYGSSAAQDMQAEAATNLAAEQANREAQHRLQQIGLGMQGAGTMGGLELQRQGAALDAALGLDRGTTARALAMSQAGTAADQQQLNQLLGYGNIFSGGQAARGQRIGQVSDTQGAYSTAISNVIGPGFERLSKNDKDLVMAIMSLPPQQRLQALESGRYGRAENWNDIKNIVTLGTMAYGDFGGGGGGATATTGGAGGDWYSEGEDLVPMNAGLYPRG